MSSQNLKYVILSLASNIFLSKNLQMEPDFTATTNDTFRSKAEQVDFSNSVDAAATINHWADSQTNHKIAKIFNAGKISFFPNRASILSTHSVK